MRPTDEIVYKLGIECELRFTVDEDVDEVTLELLDGHAEVCGSELVRNKVYKIPSASSMTVFSWRGASVRVCGKTQSAVVSSDTLMISPVSMHACLEEMRIKAELDNTRGPVSLVVGPTDAGKSSFCQTLLNYAARLGRRPVFIDLDVGQSSVSIPGTISILPVERPSHITEGFNQQALSVYPFGYKSPGHNLPLYFLLIKRLGHLIQTRLRNAHPNTRASGTIIDTCGWCRGQGYNAITLAAWAFEIDVLFVVEEERLFHQLERDMPRSVEVVFVPRQPCAVERDRFLRVRTRDKRVWEYFYGPNSDLNPFEFDVKFSEVQIFKVSPTHADAYIYAHEISTDDVAIVNVAFAPNLENMVLGLSFADSVDENLMMTNIIGFVCIVHIDMQREFMRVLSPQPGPLPSKILIMGDIRLRRRINYNNHNNFNNHNNHH